MRPQRHPGFPETTWLDLRDCDCEPVDRRERAIADAIVSEFPGDHRTQVRVIAAVLRTLRAAMPKIEEL